MAGTYFVHTSADAGIDRYVANVETTGPWSRQLQHGGPPNALAVACAERAVRDETGRDDLVALRLAAEFLGPVPVAELEVRTRVLRAARSAALAEVVLAAGGRECLHARVWFVRSFDTAASATPRPTPPPVPDAAAGLDTRFGYGDSLEWRFLTGALERPGPGVVWVRTATPLFDGHEMSGLSRAVLVADSGNGVSSELDWQAWTFVNVDLDVHLARPLEGEWVLLDAVTQLGPQGSALARSTLSDRLGVVGGGMQTLVLAPLR